VKCKILESKSKYANGLLKSCDSLISKIILYIGSRLNLKTLFTEDNGLASYVTIIVCVHFIQGDWSKG
jgi:hypothetical protein